jgi:uncharacterized phage protein (TIGR01671 family)
MRELKYKAYNKRTGEVEIVTDLYWFEENGVHANGDNDWILVEFTGLHDCNGVEIYEGDICEIMYYTPFGNKTDDFYGNWIVTMWMGQFVLIGDKERLSFTKFADVKSSEYVSNLGIVVELSETVNVKVIGNIHQNPELLS